MSIHAFSAPAAGQRTDSARCGSRFLDEPAVNAALAAVAPAIAAQLALPAVSGRGVLYLVVLDPSHPCTDAAQQPRVLCEHAIGDRARWDVDYASYAHRKALLSWRHRMDSRALQMLSPHLLRADEEPLWGSVWLDGLVVAASGAFPVWDECFSLMDFRPVAPAINVEDLADWFEPAEANDGMSPFMLFTYRVKPGRTQQIPSALHSDHTARVQTVHADTNPLFHELLAAVGRRTGVPIVVNTSFNVRGEPIVATPKAAIEAFYSTPLDALVIGSFILEK